MARHARYSIVIVGAGTAGISVAARLVRISKKLKGQIAIIDPQTKHYYQPLWTLVGGGAAKKEESERDLASLIPAGVDLIGDAVTEFRPNQNTLLTKQGTIVSYDYLVAAAGLQIDWDGVKGLKDAVGKNGVCSNYSYHTVDSTWENIRNFKGGTAIFTHPDSPVKCGGAPQKIMYLADDYFRKSNVRHQSEIIFASAKSIIFDVTKYANALEKVVLRKDIQTMYKRNLIEIRPDSKEALFEHLETGEQEVFTYDLLHVTPPMKAPSCIKESALADAGGWVDVDPYTLQHKKFANVFGIGDCSNLPTSKTGAAIRKQAPVVVRNLMSLIKGSSLDAKYDGYTSCPLVTGYNKLVLAEFDYHKVPQETFPFDQSKERFSMYLLKRRLLPIMYWNGMLKGLM
ncbi:FAD/NAD(P)-binding oxidoreductase [Bacillus licheniformis]|jgi:sulfide:quinone oxidoreductase|uniref:NAD(P)/FAD-dependent oxidoreductase n=1 Tax=Bacillus licheniformis TaxID=1402 RepID=A0A415JDH8_BACLI|nr:MULTISPECIES: FAD/NAD(P)-binding oxidoreductase [Bacillus]AKQ74043.1 oxidoreductase [Bacillus licheniformis WX-02]AMR11295.1 pyridine nucleotide-disulfide oxidoreductase [Bacillus licheniformis]AOP15953.1 Sulfide:quinone oxidoreductase, mitochondrial [Bacillus licheniformis]APJ27780.1 pyridine nucleotide-disulfide oxidoreductase [Bacillus sp. H15-1]ARC64676.1 sulfide dehydrogenase [flavocytochrome c] flavoprotein chain precursor [Bacillus licheniformis]